MATATYHMPARKAASFFTYGTIITSLPFIILTYMHLNGLAPADVAGIPMQTALQWLLGVVYAFGLGNLAVSIRQRIYLNKQAAAGGSKKKAKVKVEDGYEEDADVV